MNRIRRGVRAAAAAAVLLLGGCLPALRGTPREQVASLRGRDAEAVLYSGERVLLRAPRVEGDSVYGGWKSTASGDVPVAVALDDIERLRHVSMGPDPQSARAIFERILLLVTLAVGSVMALLLFGD